MLSYKRSTRVGELIQHEISKILLEMRDPNIGFITVTGVDLTNDLKLAKVFYSVFGDESVKKTTVEIIGKAGNFIRYTLGQRISLRYLPALEFYCDSTLEKANRVFDLLGQIENEKTEAVKAKKPAKRDASKKSVTAAGRKTEKKTSRKIKGRKKTKK